LGVGMHRQEDAIPMLPRCSRGAKKKALHGFRSVGPSEKGISGGKKKDKLSRRERDAMMLGVRRTNTKKMPGKIL